MRSIVLALCLLGTGCAATPTTVIQTKFVPVVPNARIAAECPTTLSQLPTTRAISRMTDKQVSLLLWEVYGNWVQCKKALIDVETDIANQTKQVERRNVKAAKPVQKK